ncbi:MAG: hypothetical protein AAGH68_15900, partial [Pseudomonadota bacterium]
MLNRVTVCLASSLLMLFAPISGNADQLSVRESLTIGSSQPEQGTARIWGSLDLANGTPVPANFAEDAPKGERPSGGIIGIGENFGVILDYSQDLPRVRGLAFTPTEFMRVEARGQIDADLSNVGARVSVH